MTKHTLIKTSLLTLLLATAACCYAGDEKEEKVSMDQVPQKVKDTLKKYAAETDVKAVEKGEQDDTKVYEFDIQQGTKNFEITISAKGKYLGQEEDVEFSTLPAAVQKTLTAKAAGGKISGCEKAVDNKNKVTYEATIEKDGKKTEYTVNAKGKLIDKEEAEEKGEKKEKD
jgi:uncharacterized membrane protein YkoI